MANDIYDHVEKYWDTIDNASLHNFLMVTSREIKLDQTMLELIKGYPEDNWDELITIINRRMELVSKVKERLGIGVSVGLGF